MANILITGGNRGIGLALIQQLTERGDRVTVLCRKNSNALTDTGAQIIQGVDVTDLNSVQNAKLHLQNQTFDTIINNAGILSDEAIDNMDEAAFKRMRAQFEVNTLGPLRVVRVFLSQRHRVSR